MAARMARERIQGRQETPPQAIRLVSCPVKLRKVWLRKEWLRKRRFRKVSLREDFDARYLKKCHGIQRVRVNALSTFLLVLRDCAARRRRHLQADFGIFSSSHTTASHVK